ncbi:MAG: hypothetical protein AB8G22_06670, partial [Saprospiraceae bacterium]
MRNSPPQHYGFQWVSYWLACSLLLLLTPAMGQVDLLLKLNKSSFAEQRSLLFKVDAILKKDGKQIVETAELEFELQGKAQLLSPRVLKIEMGADSIQRRRFKFLLQDKANQPDSILLISRLKSFGTPTILAQDSLWITVNPDLPLLFTNLQDEIVIQGDSARLPIRISNPNQDTIQTSVSIYTAADFIRNKSEQLQFRLSPQRDTIIRFPLKVSRSRPIPKNSPVFLKIDSPNETHTRLAHYQLYQLKSRNRFLPEGKKANFTDRFYADWLQGGFNNNLRLGFTSLGTIDNNRYELSFNPILFFDQEQLSLFNSYAAVHTPRYHWRIGNVQ